MEVAADIDWWWSEVTKEYVLEILRESGTGERLAMSMSTENLVSNENLLMLTSVLEKGDNSKTGANLSL